MSIRVYCLWWVSTCDDVFKVSAFYINSNCLGPSHPSSLALSESTYLLSRQKASLEVIGQLELSTGFSLSVH